MVSGTWFSGGRDKIGRTLGNSRRSSGISECISVRIEEICFVRFHQYFFCTCDDAPDILFLCNQAEVFLKGKISLTREPLEV
jgi:hypothetical protein